jgi:hypothetical protein
MLRTGYISQSMIFDPAYLQWVIKYVKPNVVPKWLTFLLRIREVPGSNLGSKTSYTE